MAFAGLSFVFGPTTVKSSLDWTRLVKKRGASTPGFLSPSVTHFILAPDALKRVGTRVEQAASNNAHIVSEAWLEACLAAEERVDEGPYAVGSKQPSERREAKPVESKLSFSGSRLSGSGGSTAHTSSSSDSEALASSQQQWPSWLSSSTDDALVPAAAATLEHEDKPQEPPQQPQAQVPPAAVAATTTTIEQQVPRQPAERKEQRAPRASTTTAASAATAAEDDTDEDAYLSQPEPKRATSLGKLPPLKAPAYKFRDPQPFFPERYTILLRDILQWTDMRNNHNKFYSLELHSATALGKDYYRIFTHYGRTDDVARNPDAGVRECRHLPTLAKANACYLAIYLEKTATAKGYVPVELLSSNIGSPKARAMAKRAADLLVAPSSSSSSSSSSTLHPAVASLVERLYADAENALTSTLAAKITPRGIETPLGVLTMEQVLKGEQVLLSLMEHLTGADGKHRSATVEQLSGAFYSVVPHQIGRSATAMAQAVIDTPEKLEQKLELVQLMKDMLQVLASTSAAASRGGAGGGGVSLLDMRYAALKCQIEPLVHGSPRFTQIESQVLSSQIKSRTIAVQHIFAVSRPADEARYDNSPGNERTLFHGSRYCNFVGLLSRGLLMPKAVVSRGGKRTDAGNLGNGIYFGDAACTAAQYAHPAVGTATRMMLANRVALGRIYDTTERMIGITAAPSGYHSVHGVRNTESHPSVFEDDEYVIYSPAHQKVEYLVEFTLDPSLATTTSTKATKPTPTSFTTSRPAAAAATVVAKPSSKPAPSIAVQQQQPPAPSFLETSTSTTTSTFIGFGDSRAISWVPSTTAPAGANVLESSSPFIGFDKPAPSAASFHIKPTVTAAATTTPTAVATAKATTTKPAKAKLTSFFTASTTASSSPFSSTSTTTTTTSSSSSSSSSFSSSAGLTAEQLQTKKDEDAFRRAFVGKGSMAADPMQYLVNVYEHRERFAFRDLSSDESAIPRVLTQTYDRHSKVAPAGRSSVVSRDEWLTNWNRFTHSQFAGLDWRNVFVAGGSVLSSLSALSSTAADSSSSSPSSSSSSTTDAAVDIDLFLYGLNAQQATRKVQEIYDVISRNTNNTSGVLRTANAITILGQYPYRHTQIILRLYDSPAEVLLGFDVDCCCVGFDGQNVYALPRAVRALNARYNLVDLSRRSTTYELRLFKYSKRGFCVMVPGLDRSRVPKALYTYQVKNVRGLAKLLLLDNIVTTQRIAMPQVVSKPPTRAAAAAAHISGAIVRTRDELNLDRATEFDSGRERPNDQDDESDYSNVLVPWGPKWPVKLIIRMLNTQDKSQFYAGQKRDSARHRHVFVSGIEGVLQGTSCWCSSCKAGNTPDASLDGASFFVQGPIKWATIDASQSLLTGSFNPVGAADWDRDAYDPSLPPLAVHFVPAIPGTNYPAAAAATAHAAKAATKAAPSFASAIHAKAKVPAKPFAAPGKVAMKPFGVQGKVATKPFGAPASYYGSDSDSDSDSDSPKAKKMPVKSFGAPVKSFGAPTKAKKVAMKPFGAPAKHYGPDSDSDSDSPKAKKVATKSFGAPTKSTGAPGKPFGAPTKATKVATKPKKVAMKPFGAPAKHYGPDSDSDSDSPKTKKVATKSFGAPPKVTFGGLAAQTQASLPATVQQPMLASAATTTLLLGGLPPQPSGGALAMLAERMYQPVVPQSFVSKLLLLVARMHSENMISASERDTLKDLVLRKDPGVFAALEVFEVEHDFAELADTLRRVCHTKRA